MVIVPDSNIILLKCPLELDMRNQLTFSNATAQYNYFSSLPKLQVEDATYQRKDGVIRFPTHTNLNDNLPTFEDLLGYDYCMYQNNSFDDKWFYAKVIKVTYVNDGMSEVTIDTDVFQSWQFDLVLKDSYIEREHVSNDTIGVNTIPENISTGDYVSTSLQPTFNFDTALECGCVLAASEFIDTGSTYQTSNVTIPQGLYYIGFKSQLDLTTMIKAYDKAGKGDAIQYVFVAPLVFFGSWKHNHSFTVEGTTFTFAQDISYSPNFMQSSDAYLDKINYLDDGYYPVNNKLLTYPYSFLQVSNHNGVVVNYKWEEFNKIVPTQTQCHFKLSGVLSAGCSFRCYPIDYKRILDNYDENITLGKFPIGSWTSDVYTNWLTQNGVNILGHHFTATEARVGSGALLGISGITDVASGLTNKDVEQTAQGMSDVSGGAIEIFNALQDDYRHSLIPDQALGNTNTGDYSYEFGLTDLEFKRISIKREFAVIIDKYFSAFGYKVNRLGIPNLNNRSNWNYVKTIGVNLTGNIPVEDKRRLETMFNSGCTFWHTTAYFLDYSRTNSIVS